MGYPPICQTCGESVADYKGPCPKPSVPTSPPTMAEQSAEVDHEGAKRIAEDWAQEWGQSHCRTLARAYLAQGSELRAALAREVEAKKDRDDWKECYRFENECFLNAGVEHDRRIEALAAAEARCAEMVKYARHEYGCPAEDKYKGYACTCGLAAALKEPTP